MTGAKPAIRSSATRCLFGVRAGFSTNPHIGEPLREDCHPLQPHPLTRRISLALSLRNAGRLQWRDGLGLLEPDVGVELLRQDGLEVMAPELGLGAVDHTTRRVQ